MAWEKHFGINPLTLLTNGAQFVIERSGEKPPHRDLKAIYEMTPQKRARLSERIERDTGDSVRYCIEDIESIPKTVPTARNGELKSEAESHAEEIDKAFAFDLPKHLKGFAGPNGAISTSDYQEVLDVWKEAIVAWEMFRNKTNNLAKRR